MLKKIFIVLPFLISGMFSTKAQAEVDIKAQNAIQVVIQLVWH